MPEQPHKPRDAEAAVGAYAPLLREMMLDADQKKKYGVPPASWWLFTSTKVRNTHVPPNSRCVAASDFSYLTDIRAAFERGDKRRDLYVDAEEFGASAMVQSVRKEGPSGLKSKWVRQITPLTPPQNDRYEELAGTVLITGGAGGLGRLLTDYLLHYYPNCSVAIASRSAKESEDPRRKCYACDVCDEDDVRRVCDSIPDLIGVIHCAGVTYGGPFTQTNETDSKLLFDIKYWGTRYLYAATKDRKLRLEDAINATKAAVEEGIVVGGGCALLYASQDLDKVKVKGDDQKAGVEIVKSALQAPIRQITTNAGVDGSVVVGKLLEANKPSNGYDAQTEQYVDMFKEGIIDPVKVVRTALQDAASIAGLLVTTEAMVALSLIHI